MKENKNKDANNKAKTSEGDNNLETKNPKLDELQEKYDKLLADYEELASKFKELGRDTLVYKASHDKIMETKRAQDILKKKEQEILNEKKYAHLGFIKEILEPIELLEQSLSMKNVPDVVKNWLKGFEMILEKMISVLHASGIKEIKPEIDSKLDSHLHEVIGEVEDENIKSGNIARVVRKGYILHDRVIKYAQVITNKQKDMKKENEK